MPERREAIGAAVDALLAVVKAPRDCVSGEPCSSWCPCAKEGVACVPTSGRPAGCVRCHRYIGGTAPTPPHVLLAVAVLRCAGPRVWVECRPNPHWGYQRWPGTVLRWRRTRAEVEFWCGRVGEVRTVHYSRLTPRREAHRYETGVMRYAG